MAEKIVKGHCPACGPERFADVVGEHSDPFDDHEAGLWGCTDYRILKCRGCGRVFFQTDEVFSEDVDQRRNPATGEWERYLPHKINHYPPPSKREPPDWAISVDISDSKLGSLFSDMYGAINAELAVPAAIASRTVFDRASELLGVDPAIRFEEKLSTLTDEGKISRVEKETLEILTDAGGAAAHRGWRPTPHELDTMVQIVENFLHRNFVLGDASKALKANLPVRQARKPKP